MFNAAMCCNHCSTPVLKEDTVTGITWHTSWSTPWHTRCTWPSLSCRVWQSQEPGDHQDWGRRAKNRWITEPETRGTLSLICIKTRLKFVKVMKEPIKR